MANRQLVKSSTCSSKSTSSSNIQLRIRGVPFTLDRELWAARSAKLFVLLKENLNGDLSHLLRDIPADPEAFKLVVRFCHGFDLNISAENVVPLSCLAHYLGMTETHSTDNLLKKALTYFERRIIPSWNESVKALRASEKVLKQAVSLGLVDACAESIIAKAQVNPRHLGEPINNSTYEDDDGEDKENGYRTNARRRLFVLDRQPEGLTILSLEILSLQIYEPIMQEMIQRQVPPEYVAASLCQYAKKWVFSSSARGDDMSIYRRNSQREVIEAVERLLPRDRGLLPCTLLFEMLNSAIFLEASSECRAGFEIRVGKQLDQAKVNDLLIPSQGYAKELEYDVECVKRILKNFYCNYTSSDVSGLIKVAELVENLLAEIASDVDLKTSTFISLAEMTTSASVGMHRNSDGIYRAIDLYLDKHRFLTESEREEVCKVLDCHNLSPEAREHAAQNGRLPLRVVVQVLFVGQLSLRERVTKEVEASDEQLRKVVVEEEEEAARVSGGEGEVRMEMEKMGSKVIELERECLMMRREIQSGCCRRAEREKTSVWREVKRKFGCVSSLHDCNCHVMKKKKKKVHPRQ
ncbi:BTB/POZ domain-containing protein [Actinidia chinensis var. chinensis]|uniref:BTB/POZ domain-containing protein n=1 Tax=Actinidia chinensis var. chinensis TaxID=1590841 RepID=A0A2R6RCY1_ACTCC|nr:BTB/POZ domain-containing protein [Actinidia chinensis var. chinensis]